MNHEVLKAILLTIYLVVSFIGAGNLISRILKIENNFPLSFIIGYSIYGLIFYYLYFFMATPGLALILGILSPGFIYGIMRLPKMKPGIINVSNFKSQNKLLIVLLASACLMLLVLLFRSSGPVKLGDAINGYLETSRWIYHNGFKTFDPHITEYSLMPGFTESVYSISFVFGNEYTAKILDGFASVAFLYLIYSFSIKTLSFTTSVILTVSFLCLSQFQWLIGGGKIDVISQSVYTASLYLLLVDDFSHSKPKLQNLILSFMLLFVAMASKYTNYLFVPFHIMVLGYYFFSKKIDLNALTKLIAAGIIGFCIIVSPHYFRDYHYTMNPVSPIPNPFFHDNIAITHLEINDKYYIVNKFSLKEYILFPYTFFVEGLLHTPKSNFPLTFLIAIIFAIIGFKLLKYKKNPAFIFLCIQLIIWIYAFKIYWPIQRYIFGLIFLFFYFTFKSFDLNAPFAKTIRKVSMYLLIGYCLFFAYQNRRFIYDLEFATNKLSFKQWEAKSSVRGESVIAAIAPKLDSANKLFFITNGGIFLVPYDKLKYTSTDIETVAFQKMTENEQLLFLKKNKFRYCYFRSSPGSGDLPDFFVKDTAILKDPNVSIYKSY